MTGHGVTGAAEWNETETQEATTSTGQAERDEQNRSSSARDPEINSG